MKHTKKLLSDYFDDVVSGRKPFEVRKEDDCTYEVGDLIELIELSKSVYGGLAPNGKMIEGRIPTGRKQLVEVTHKLTHEQFPHGINKDYVILGIKLRSDEE